MKNTKSKPAVAQPKRNGAFFTKGSGQDFFGSSKEKGSFFPDTAAPCVQPKLTVGKANDSYEQEADSMADKVVQRLAKTGQSPSAQNTSQHESGQAPSLASSVTPLVQRRCAECEKEELEQSEKDDETGVQRKPIFESEAEADLVQRKCSHCEAAEQKQDQLQRKADNGGGAAATPSVEHALASSKGGGTHLPDHVNRSWSGAFGSDLSHVRIHNDAHAAQMNDSLHAQAFTHGNDIYFNAGKYSPNEATGKHLLAHEITHTIQQRGSNPLAVQREPTTNAPTQTPPYKAKGVELNPTTKPKTLKIDEIDLPAFKGRNSDKFKQEMKVPMTERPKLKQVPNWIKAVRETADKSVEKFIKKVQQPAPENGQKPPGIYFLITKDKQFRLFGTRELIQAECYIPKWNSEGKKNLHQVDHIVEWQLGGVDAIENYELTDAVANQSSGSLIQIERKKRVEGALADLKKAGTPNVPSYEEVNTGNANTAYLVTFKKVGQFKIPCAGNPDVRWIRTDIEKGSHLEHLRGMTATEVSETQGSKDELVLYVNPNSGSPIRLPLPARPIEKKWPGLDIIDYQITSPTAGDNVAYGELKLKLRDDLTKSLKAGDAFTVKFKKTPGLLNTGYMAFSRDQSALGSIMRFVGLSPVTIDEFTLDDTKGIVAHGTITVDGVPLIKGTAVELSLIGDDLSISKTFTLSEIKDFPGPFKPTEMSLSVFASTKEGLGVDGTLGFEIKNLGKGELVGMGSGKGFGIKGKFEFESKKFEGSFIDFTYENNKWSIGGTLNVKNGNFNGIETAQLAVKYADEKISAKGDAKLTIQGIDSVHLDAVFSETGDFVIKGGADIKKMPGISSGHIDAEIKKTGDDFDFGFSGKAQPSLPKMPPELNTELAIEYNSKTDIFKASADFSYAKGRYKVSLKIGVTNDTAEGGELKGVKGNAIIFFGTGKLTVTFIEGKAEGEFKAEVKPGGELFISGKAELKPTALMSPFEKEKVVAFPALHVPVVGVPFVSIFLEIGGGVKFYVNWQPLTVSGFVTLPDTNINEIASATLGIQVGAKSTVTAGAGMQLSAKIGAEAAVVQVSGGVDGFAGLEVVGDIGADLKMELNLQKGLVPKGLDAEIKVTPKAKFQLDGVIGVYINLIFDKINVWEWKKKLAEGSIDLSDLGGLKVTLPVKFDDKGNVILPDLEAIKVEKPEFSAQKGRDLMEAVFNDKKKEKPQEKEDTTQRIRAAIAQDLKIRLKPGMSHDLQKHALDLEQKWSNSTSPDLGAFVVKTIKDEMGFMANDAFDKLKNDLRGVKKPLPWKLAQIDEYERQWAPYNDKSMTTILRDELNGEEEQKKTPLQKKPIFESNAEEHPDEALQRKGGENAGATTIPVEHTVDSTKGKGAHLPANTRREMESSFGADFSQVNVHTDSTSVAMNEQLQSRAFTNQNDIYFNAGNYQPGEREGKRLLAHELTHVVQQNEGQKSDSIQRDDKKSPPAKDPPPKNPPAKDVQQIPLAPPKPSNPIYTGNTQATHSGDPYEKGVRPKDFLPFETGDKAWSDYLKSAADSMNVFGSSVNASIKQANIPVYSPPSGKDFMNQVGYSTEVEGKSTVGSLKSSTGLKALYDFNQYKWIPNYEGKKQPDPPTFGRVSYPIEVAYTQTVNYSDSKQRNVTVQIDGKIIFTPEQWLQALGLKVGLIHPSALLGLTGSYGSYAWTLNGKGPKFQYHDENKAGGEKNAVYSLDALSKVQTQKELHGKKLPPVMFTKPYILPGDQFTAIQNYLDTVDKIHEDYLASLPKDKSRDKVSGGGSVVAGDMKPTRAGAPISSGEIPTWLKVLGGIFAAVVVIGLIILLVPVIASGLVALAGYLGVTLAIGTAIKIVVGGLLIASFIMSLVHRIKEGWGKHSFLKILGVSLLDTIGIGPVIECINDTSILTGEDLNRGAFSRSFDCTMGVAGLIGSVLGLKNLFRKAPGATGAPVDIPTTTDVTPPEPTTVKPPDTPPAPPKQPEPVKPGEPTPDPWGDAPAPDPAKQPVPDPNKQPAPPPAQPDQPAQDPWSGDAPKDKPAPTPADKQPVADPGKPPVIEPGKKPAPEPDKQPTPAPDKPAAKKRRIIVTVPEKKPPTSDKPPAPKETTSKPKVKPGKDEGAGQVEKPETAKPPASDTPDFQPDNIDDLKPGTQVSVPIKNRSRAEVVKVNKDTIVIKVRSKSSSSDIINEIPKETFIGWLKAKTAFVYSKLRAYLMNNRPKHAKSLIEKVWNAAKGPDGQVRDPNPPHEILTWDTAKSRYDQWHMGHKPEFEYRKLVDRLVSGEIDFDEFLGEYSNPENYWPEDPTKNMSHGFEAE